MAGRNSKQSSTAGVLIAAEERAAKAIKLKIEGKTNKAIAEILGVHPNTVSKYIKRAREAALVPPPQDGDALTEECYHLRKEGWSYQKIADKVGKNIGDVWRRVKSRIDYNRNEIKEGAQEALFLEMDRLDMVLDECMSILQEEVQEHILTDHRGNEKLVFSGPSYKDKLLTLDKIIQAGKRRSELLGLDRKYRPEEIKEEDWDIEVDVGVQEDEDL